jgi:flagellar export protein FliJ
MNDRAHRIARIVELRQKELDGVVLALAEQRANEDRARLLVEQAINDLGAAEARRRALAESGAEARAFLETEEWITSLSIRRRRAAAALSDAQAATRASQEKVFGAKNRLRQVELMSVRLASAERVIRLRAERRRDDEAAARMARRVTQG